jgi:tRNA(Arg) A34 adenosine deaminase TadA
MSTVCTIEIPLPAWVRPFLAAAPRSCADDDQAMALAIALAQENSRRGTGGPFGALVLESSNGRVLAAGVNLVVASRCSIAHAEMVALCLAQQGLGGYDLATAIPGGATLVSSAEPCAMCMGAVPWSGIGRLVCGARDEDARAAGFDEGDKPTDWVAAYQRRGIAVTRDCLRPQARAVLLDYAGAGGLIYGPGQR